MGKFCGLLFLAEAQAALLEDHFLWRPRNISTTTGSCYYFTFLVGSYCISCTQVQQL